MKEQKIILGVFEDEWYADVARRDLEAAGIRANILKDNSNAFILFSEPDKTVQIVISDTHIEKAKKILQRKFI